MSLILDMCLVITALLTDFFISPTATVKMPEAYEGELVRKVKGGVARFYLR